MKNLQVHNSRFITYTDDTLTIDILGGVDLLQIERMICTLRITFQNYPPLRSTLDLYNDTQTDKLLRTICSKWSVTLVDASKSIHAMITQLENYKLGRLKYPPAVEPECTPRADDQKNAKQFLKKKN